jgi:hypothetical protein
MLFSMRLISYLSKRKKKSRWSFSIRLETLEERGKMDMKYLGKLDRVLLIGVILPPLDKYSHF